MSWMRWWRLLDLKPKWSHLIDVDNAAIGALVCALIVAGLIAAYVILT